MFAPKPKAADAKPAVAKKSLFDDEDPLPAPKPAAKAASKKSIFDDD
jgi:hypothetical protein